MAKIVSLVVAKHKNFIIDSLLLWNITEYPNIFGSVQNQKLDSFFFFFQVEIKF